MIYFSPTHARVCHQFFIGETIPQQKTQFYVSKDILTYKNIKTEYLGKLSRLINSIDEKSPDSILSVYDQVEKEFNAFRAELQSYTRTRLTRQIERITTYRETSPLIINENSAIRTILKKLRKSGQFLDTPQEFLRVKKPTTISQIKKSVKRQVHFQIRQYEFYTIYTHLLLHHFFEITAQRASHPLDGIPVSYMSKGWKFEEPFEIMWEMLNTAPKLKFAEVENVKIKNTELYEIEEKFVSEIRRYIQRVEKSLEKFELNQFFDVSGSRNILKSFIEKSEGYKQKLNTDSITAEQYIKAVTELADGVTLFAQSHLGEVWVLSRLPLLGHEYKANITTRDLLHENRLEYLNENLHDKEFDIYSVFNVFGKKLHFIGETKFFSHPLHPRNRKNMEKIEKQIKMTREIFKQFDGEEYEIHIFLINGVYLDAKNILESSDVIVHGPIYKE